MALVESAAAGVSEAAVGRKATMVAGLAAACLAAQEGVTAPESMTVSVRWRAHQIIDCVPHWNSSEYGTAC